jgi:hypothetical protein
MKAYEFLKNHGWCQGTMAKTANGTNVPVNHPQAECFCMMGAVEAVYYWDYYGLYPFHLGNEHRFSGTLKQLEKIIDDKSCRHLGDVTAMFNDAPGRTKEEVLAVLKEAGV